MTVATRIPDAVLAEQWFGLVHRFVELIQKRYRQSGLTQKVVAERIGKKASFVSRCLSGQQNMTLRTLHDLARAMDCRVDIELTPLASVMPRNTIAQIPTAISSISVANENKMYLDQKVVSGGGLGRYVQA